jgi:hypothetical protein
MDGLTVGRMVHYVAYGTPGGEFAAGVHRAAVVTEITTIGPEGPADPNNIGLCVLNPTGQFFNQHVPYDEGKKPGTWHWIEKA